MKYKKIYDIIGNKFIIKSLLEIYSINNDINGRYIFARNNNMVNINDLVVDEKGILIGRIIESNSKKNIVKIQIITDNNSNLPVVVSNINGIIYGSNDKDCNIIFEPINNNYSYKEIKDNELVLTSSYSNLIISGVTVGMIKNKNNKLCVENKNIDNITNIAVIS